MSISGDVLQNAHGDVATTSLASRNPARDVIPVCSHVQAKRTDAKKITANAWRALNKENANALQLEIDQFFEQCDTEILCLSKKFHKSEASIKILIGSESKYQKMHAPSLRNALVHAKGLKMNADHQQGDRLNLAQIQKLVDEDASMQGLSKDQELELIEDLKAHHDLNRTGVRISNAAAALDCQGAVDRVSTEIRNLSDRTGMCALEFFMRMHIHNTAVPSWADSDDAIAFVSEVLKVEPMEFLARFEQWACTRIPSDGAKENLQTIRSDCTRLVIEGLCAILNLRSVVMSYVNYERNIVSKYKVELVGWPSSIKFINPSKIGTIDEIQKLRQALKVGDCKWIVQSQRQQAAHAEELAVKEAAGRLVVKKRKERSDKGKPRAKGSKKGVLRSGAEKQGGTGSGIDEEEDGGHKDSRNEEENQQPPKKKRKCATTAMSKAAKQLLPAPKSRAFISDHEDDSD